MPLDIDLQMARLEVKLLRAQFSSHFLFNHLNAINYRILSEEPEMASSHLTLFARLLRRITADSHREFVRLSDEMETLRLFIKLESMRFSQPIHFVTSIESGLDPAHVWVPSLVLHSYVENAIWHVLQQQEEAGAIQLKLVKISTRYHLLLEDNGRVHSKRLSDRLKPHDQAGLDLIGERLRLLNRQFGTDLQVTLGDPELAGESHPGVLARHRGIPRGRRVDLSFQPFAI